MRLTQSATGEVMLQSAANVYSCYYWMELSAVSWQPPEVSLKTKSCYERLAMGSTLNRFSGNIQFEFIFMWSLVEHVSISEGVNTAFLNVTKKKSTQAPRGLTL